jgi:hypothetical protein
VPVKSLILVPAIVTFAITLLRLVGELQNWSPSLFNKSAGGGGALIGISWLVPVFGIYFAVRLVRMGFGPQSRAKAFLLPLAAFGLLTACLVVSANVLKFPFRAQLIVICVASFAALAVAYPGWKELWVTLGAYALAARIPVAIVMLVAMIGNWGTHYDVAPPEAPGLATASPFVKWLWIGLLPQATVWIYVTVVGGMIFGGIAALVVRRKA